MGNIVLLDDLTINQMAAGEVIERPANVVKELVENSIDAGANKIIIEIKKGGKTFIKITDNGKGINKDDMVISIERHATSKIKQVEDLEKTYTMGFRGEALASIASISKMTMISRTKEESVGKKMVVEAGDIIELDEVASQVGTSILVENIFFNTPVRYKFLKQDATEFRYIRELIEKLAIANPNISFRLINDGKNTFQTSGNGSLKDIIYLLYGKEIQENIVDVNYEENNIKITGVIGNTRIAKDSRKNQIIYLNKRNIKNSTITGACDQAFSGSTGIGKYGFFILNLEMPASYYDVNVHPTKNEVRFKDEEQLYKAVYSAVKSSILTENFLGNSEKSIKKDNYVTNEYNFLTSHFKNEAFSKKIESGNLSVNAESKNIENTLNSSTENNNMQTNELERESLSTENQSNSESIIRREEKRKIEYKFVGILFRTYIIVEIGKEIYLIDQHAAHERLLYEQIKENYKNNIQSDVQMLLIPEVIDLSNKEIEFIKNNMDMLNKIGYEIEFFGDKTIKINGIPNLDYRSKTNTREMFLDLLDEMITNSRTAGKNIEERFIATVACKAAVKAHMDLSKSEVDYLVQNLLTLQNPYTCPHGRPTTIKFNKEDMP